jgi:hypothetical protein
MWRFRHLCVGRAGGLLTSSIALCFLFQPAFGQFAEDTLLPYAVNIDRTPTQSWRGYGIYLGRGFFLTAAHVVGRSWLTRPKVVIAGLEYPTNVVKEGSFQTTDLTLLSVDENLLPSRLRLRRLALCRHRPRPGEQVITVVPEGIASSHIIAPGRIPIGARRFSTAITDVAKTGNSGSGVFDARQRCLLGIMSRKISERRSLVAIGKSPVRDIAKYFVPASEIADFLPPAVGL